MKNTIYAMALASILFSCNNNNEPKKASTDLVTNPISATDTTSDTVNQKGAQITFEKTLNDFGTITQGEQAEYSFKFINTGGSDLLISAANASCGCTVPEYPKEPIKSGGSGYIKVKFNSDHRLNAFEKTVTITANTTPLETVLTIKGFVNPKPGNPNTNTPIF